MTRTSGTLDNSVESGARIAVAILKEWIAPDDLRAIRDDGKHPGDYCDDNIAYYGAFAAIRFAEPDPANETDAIWLDAVATSTMEILTQ